MLQADKLIAKAYYLANTIVRGKQDQTDPY